MAQLPRLADQNIASDTGTADAVATARPEGESLMERLLNREAEPAVDLADAIAADVAQTANPDAAPKDEQRSGLRGFFSRNSTSNSDAPEPNTAVQDAQTDVTLAALPTPNPDDAPKSEPRRSGLFGLGSAKTAKQNAPKASSEIAPGTVLPYGKIARICDLPKREMGKKIAQYPERNPVHMIYDTNPGNPGPHTFFLTGFDDGCARQFTASMALFGPVEMHEQLRYGLPAKVQPYSDTDKAYEKVKSRVCGVGNKKPCGAKISRLDRSTVFVSIYERFGSNPHWTNLLIHQGDILAQDRKGG